MAFSPQHNNNINNNNNTVALYRSSVRDLYLSVESSRYLNRRVKFSGYIVQWLSTSPLNVTFDRIPYNSKTFLQCPSTCAMKLSPQCQQECLNSTDPAAVLQNCYTHTCTHTHGRTHGTAGHYIPPRLLAAEITSRRVILLGMYRISGSGWLDIRPFFRIRFRPKRYQVPDISAG